MLRRQGFAKVSISEEQAKILSEMYNYAKLFYQTDEGKGCPYKEDKEIGYSNVEKVAKEFFAVSNLINSLCTNAYVAIDSIKSRQ